MAASPVNGVLSMVPPGLSVQEVTDGMGVGEELCIGVEGHGIHRTCAPADVRALGA